MTNVALIVAVLAGVVPSGAALADGRKLVVVVARGSPVTDLSRTALRRCFTGEGIAVDGKALTPFNAPPGAPERSGFDRAILGMSPDEAGRFWIAHRIRAQGDPPRTVPSPTLIAKVVAKFPGAISYLPADQLTADVQPVTVDGVAYTDPRYSLVIAPGNPTPSTPVPLPTSTWTTAPEPVASTPYPTNTDVAADHLVARTGCCEHDAQLDRTE